MTLLAEIPYPRIDPILFSIGDDVHVRWYGFSYIVAFFMAWVVLRRLAQQKRWPVEADRVPDVLFWGILGVMAGGRLGYVFFYDIWMPNFEWGSIYKFWEGGMSFHGGLLGVVVAYWIYARKTNTPRGVLFDGLALATPIGIFCVRLGNFINAELYGRVWNGPWAMRFPNYDAAREIVDGKWTGRRGPEFWEAAGKPMLGDLRHPSQLYEALGEGLLLFLLLWWLMRRGIGGGRIAGAFLIGYGTVRFFIEFVREPDRELGFMSFGVFTRGQELCFLMIAIGLSVLWRCGRAAARSGRAAA